MKLTRGIVPMMLRDRVYDSYKMQWISGFVLGNFGISKNPYTEDLWSVTHLPTGCEVHGYIQRRKDAVELMIAFHEIIGDTELTQVQDMSPLYFLLKGIIQDWANSD